MACAYKFNLMLTQGMRFYLIFTQGMRFYLILYSGHDNVSKTMFRKHPNVYRALGLVVK